ncbi:MAG: hypothetical protein Q9207_007629 [Kuettlingeria erythrocarpa]
MSPIFAILFVFLTLTNAQSPGAPTFSSSYPPCAAQCQLATLNGPPYQFNACAFTTTTNLTCLCDAGNRAATAACNRVSCLPAEYSTTETLAQQVCGPLYSNGTLSQASVTAAIAASTAAADVSLAGKDITDPNDYPACGRDCLLRLLPDSGCGSLANNSCVCNNRPLGLALASCDQNACGAQDLQTVFLLAYRLCSPVGGAGNASEIANQSIATLTAGSLPVPVGPTGSVMPFTGGVGGKVAELLGGWLVFGMAVAAASWFV